MPKLVIAPIDNFFITSQEWILANTINSVPPTVPDKVLLVPLWLFIFYCGLTHSANNKPPIAVRLNLTVHRILKNFGVAAFAFSMIFMSIRLLNAV